MKKYGIGKVVGGFGREMTPEESIPYALNRTQIEHYQLKNAIDIASANMQPENFFRRQIGKDHEGTPQYKLVLKKSLEVGCGYGRNLMLLAECSSESFGIERDDELAKIAQDLNPATNVSTGVIYEQKYEKESMDLVLTFTFLQHLVDTKEFMSTVHEITKVVKKGGCLIIAEEVDPEVTDETCVGRPIEVYEKLFDKFEVIATAARRIEATFPKPASGAFMIMRKK